MVIIVIIDVVDIVLSLDDVIVLQDNVIKDVNWDGILKFVSKVGVLIFFNFDYL